MLSGDMDSASADSRKSSRRRHPKTSKKVDGSCASQASSSSAGSSLSSSRVSTPSLATNASSTSAGVVAASSSCTSATSDMRPKVYDRDMLMELNSAHLSHVRPAGLSSDHETEEGVWDPDRWFASVCGNMAETNMREKRKQPVDMDVDAGIRKRPPGNGSKSAGAAAEVDIDDERISLAPQRSSFLSGCQVKRSATGQDSKRDGRERRESARIGSGRVTISERLADKDPRKDDRGVRYDRHRDGFEKGDAGDRRRADHDADDLGRGRYSRDVDNGFSSRLDRDEGFRSDRYDRDDSRMSKSRLDRDQEDLRYNSRRKDGSFRSKNDYMDRRDGDRRANKQSGYNCESSGYGRGYATAEPEWYTEGPASQSDTIELHGFDGAHGERTRTRSNSGDDNYHDDGRIEERRTKAERRRKDDRGVQSGSVKIKDILSDRSHGETCDTMSNTLLDEEHNQKNEHKSSERADSRDDGASTATSNPAMSSQNTSEFDFNKFFPIDNAALGLGLDGLPVVNSTAGSRLWKWSGRVYADDAVHAASTNGDALTKTSHHDGNESASGETSGLIDTKALLSLLQKPDQQTPSLPSLFLDSRLAPHSATAPPPPTHEKVAANVQALLDSASQPTATQRVLPLDGKVVRLEELEAAQLSPLAKSPLIPGSSSTPADSAVRSSKIVNVSRDPGSVSAETRHHTAAPIAGPAHGHVHRGPAPALPAGAQVQTLEEIEAGLRSMTVASSSSPVSKASTGTSAAGGDLSAFNKLLHFVNKSQPLTDQSQSTVKTVQQEVTSSAGNSTAAAAANRPVTSYVSELSQAGPASVPAIPHSTPAVTDSSAVMQHQKLYQLHQQQQQQLYLQQQMMKDPQVLIAYLQHLPNQGQQQHPGNISPAILQQQLRSHSPRAPSPIMFGSQPPISIAAPMPIHSRQRLPFVTMAPPPQPPAAAAAAMQPQPMVAMHQTADAMHRAAVHPVIQKQLQEQKQRQAQLLQQPQVMIPTDRNMSVTASLPPANQLPNSVTAATRTTGASLIPTSVIRNMAGQRTTDDRHLKDGDVLSVNEGHGIARDVIRLDSASAAGVPAGGALRPAVDGIVNGPVSSYPYTDHPALDPTILLSPNTRPQVSEQNKNRRPLIGQGTMNATDGPAVAAVSFGTLPQNVAATHASVGRPIVKGQMPFGMMGPSSTIAGVPAAANCRMVEQLQLMSQLAQQQQQQHQRPVHTPVDSVRGQGQLIAGYMHQPAPTLSVNNAAVRPQPQLRAGGQQCMPPIRQLLQAAGRPASNQAFMDSIDKHPDAVARLLASGVGDLRLPNVPAQLAKTVDEIECAVPPAAN